jgi:hypothetical protein
MYKYARGDKISLKKEEQKLAASKADPFAFLRPNILKFFHSFFYPFAFSTLILFRPILIRILHLYSLRRRVFLSEVGAKEKPSGQE